MENRARPEGEYRASLVDRVSYTQVILVGYSGVNYRRSRLQYPRRSARNLAAHGSRLRFPRRRFDFMNVGSIITLVVILLLLVVPPILSYKGRQRIWNETREKWAFIQGRRVSISGFDLDRDGWISRICPVPDGPAVRLKRLLESGEVEVVSGDSEVHIMLRQAKNKEKGVIRYEVNVTQDALLSRGMESAALEVAMGNGPLCINGECKVPDAREFVLLALCRVSEAYSKLG
jgi:hypothetical protein